jgi:pimeloyl-ACP methyl ester carboxylesterase
VTVPAFLVHGVPDTAALWDDLRAHLARTDVIAPNLPGFAAPQPDGFGATKEEYVDWLIGEVEQVGEPVDIVGHDWGSLLVQRVVSLRPELVRTWAAGAATVDRTYVWHEVAKMWQTPGVGEQVMAAMTPDATVDALAEQMGSRDKAAAVAARVDDTMKECILALYRSAAAGFGEWHDDVDRVLPTRPGIVFWGANDAFVTPDFGERLAQRTHAELAMYNTGHWWPVTQAAEVAAALERLWSAAG